LIVLNAAFPTRPLYHRDVFDGALSPWHLAIIAVALFLVVGPKRIANRLNHVGRTVQRLVDDDGRDVKASAPTGPPTPARRSLAYRLGRVRRRGARASIHPKSWSREPLRSGRSDETPPEGGHHRAQWLPCVAGRTSCPAVRSSCSPAGEALAERWIESRVTLDDLLITYRRPHCPTVPSVARVSPGSGPHAPPGLPRVRTSNPRLTRHRFGAHHATALYGSSSFVHEHGISRGCART